MEETGFVQRPKKVYFRIVGRNREWLKVTFDVDIGGSLLMKKEFMEKLLVEDIEKAYGTLIPDSEGYRSRWKSNHKN